MCFVGTNFIPRRKTLLMKHFSDSIIDDEITRNTVRNSIFQQPARARMNTAATAQKPPREYRKHGNTKRLQAIRKHGLDAIDGRTIHGKPVKEWMHNAIARKGGKHCPVGTKALIEAGAFCLWRALHLREYLIKDARARGTPVNKRTRRLPRVHEQYDAAMNQWQRINDALELDKGLDLARRLMMDNGER